MQIDTRTFSAEVEMRLLYAVVSVEEMLAFVRMVSLYTTRHTAVMVIYFRSHPTNITVQMLSTGGEE